MSTSHWETESLTLGFELNRVDGPIRVDNGGGFGNSYQAKIFFSPLFRFEFLREECQVEGESCPVTGFSVRIKQSPEQFALSTFSAEVRSVDVDLSALEASTIVGTGTMKQGPSQERFELRVKSADGSQAKLQLVTPESGSPLDISITVLRNPGDENQTGGLGFLVESLSPQRRIPATPSRWARATAPTKGDVSSPFRPLDGVRLRSLE